jgi:hypothetical protein
MRVDLICIPLEPPFPLSHLHNYLVYIIVRTQEEHYATTICLDSLAPYNYLFVGNVLMVDKRV